uniref:Putative ISG12 protein n=1 Tax=Strongylocentrotus purpuratus TaxID=7668 RepID=Q6IEA5_STRPU|nr:TPA: putative ISG12 protein [Strongylocentrotus purpuratus]
MASIGTIVGVVAGAGVAAVGVPVVLGVVGFTGAGIAAGSYAAGMMSSAAVSGGGTVAAGTTSTVCQVHWVLLDSASSTTAALGAGGAAGALLLRGGWQSSFLKPLRHAMLWESPHLLFEKACLINKTPLSSIMTSDRPTSIFPVLHSGLDLILILPPFDPVKYLLYGWVDPFFLEGILTLGPFTAFLYSFEST